MMMLYKNMKATVFLLDGDTDFFEVVTGVEQPDILVPYLFLLCQDNILWKSVDTIE